MSSFHSKVILAQSALTTPGVAGLKNPSNVPGFATEGRAKGMSRFRFLMDSELMSDGLVSLAAVDAIGKFHAESM
jgi:hypothetical protein